MLTVTVRNILKRTTIRLYSSAAVDPQQEQALEEKCFLVDENDKIIGQASKRDCHLVREKNEILLHRAFSVFLFNKNGDLILQKRSSNKITYPDCYTNSCCSHPIADIQGEDDETNAMGIKRAARRRLNYELGIPESQIPLDQLHYITRVYYKDCGNGKWGEHEIDYVLFMQANVTIKPNSNEISEISYIPRKNIDSFIPTLNSPLTPWFSLILKYRLKYWWDHLDNLNEITDHKKIHKLEAAKSCT